MSAHGRLRVIIIGAVFSILFSPGYGSANWLNGETGLMQIPLTTIDGDQTTLDALDSDVILVVNTASNCGFASQFGGLEKVYQDYKNQSFTVVGIPSNDFLNQEPLDDAGIQEYVEHTWGVTFPMMAKTHVRFKDVHPLYTYLTKESPFPGPISWNFNKFLIDKKGRVVARFASRVKPDSEEIRSVIEKMLEIDAASVEN
ncbi:glutathione peroxidase [bacterium]|nr:glutathione peroxidase [bacterium]